MKLRTIIYFGLTIGLITSCGQQQIKTPANALNKFETFKSKAKFIPDTAMFYSGIANPAMRPTLTEKINSATDDFKILAETGVAS